MQTFLPYPDFKASAQVLDNKRLGKQRVECLQIMNTITGKSVGWIHHPCTRMWSKHPYHLTLYMYECIEEWVARGFKNTIECYPFLHYSDEQPPSWLGNEAFHASHKAALLYKEPDWYGQFNWSEQPELNYLWPTT